MVSGRWLPDALETEIPRASPICVMEEWLNTSSRKKSSRQPAAVGTPAAGVLLRARTRRMRVANVDEYAPQRCRCTDQRDSIQDASRQLRGGHVQGLRTCARVSRRGQGVVESISIDTRWECSMKMRNPDRFFMSVREKGRPQAEYELIICRRLISVCQPVNPIPNHSSRTIYTRCAGEVVSTSANAGTG